MSHHPLNKLERLVVARKKKEKDEHKAKHRHTIKEEIEEQETADALRAAKEGTEV